MFRDFDMLFLFLRSRLIRKSLVLSNIICKVLRVILELEGVLKFSRISSDFWLRE